MRHWREKLVFLARVYSFAPWDRCVDSFQDDTALWWIKSHKGGQYCCGNICSNWRFKSVVPWECHDWYWLIDEHAQIHSIECLWRLADVLACSQKVSHPEMRLVCAAIGASFPFSILSYILFPKGQPSWLLLMIYYTISDSSLVPGTLAVSRYKP
jgi:hypothetical protein